MVNVQGFVLRNCGGNAHWTMLGSCEGSVAGMTGAMASCVDSSFITPLNNTSDIILSAMCRWILDIFRSLAATDVPNASNSSACNARNATSAVA